MDVGSVDPKAKAKAGKKDVGAVLPAEGYEDRGKGDSNPCQSGKSEWEFLVGGIDWKKNNPWDVGDEHDEPWDPPWDDESMRLWHEQSSDEEYDSMAPVMTLIDDQVNAYIEHGSEYGSDDGVDHEGDMRWLKNGGAALGCSLARASVFTLPATPGSTTADVPRESKNAKSSVRSGCVRGCVCGSSSARNAVTGD